MADIGTTADVFYYGTQNQTIDSMYSGSLPGLHPKNNQGLGIEPGGTDYGKIVLVEGAGIPASGPPPLPEPVRVFKMSWRDPDGTPAWRSWRATGAADTSGSQYSGPKNGATPISDATVLGSWVELGERSL